MSRKLEFRIKDWIPYIVKGYLEYETLNTLEIVKSIGGIKRNIGDAQEQYSEIKSVLDILVSEKYFKQIKSNEGYYWGINFENITYETTQKFVDYIKQIQLLNPNEIPQIEIKQIMINQKNYNFNLTIVVKELIGKIAEFKLFG